MLCLALAVLTGCGKDKDAEPKREHTDAVFRMAVCEEPDSLNPTTAQGQLAKEFFLLTYDPLWRLDTSGEPVNCLVEDWSLSSDQLTWTIRLRHDVTFADEAHTPLTAEDVRFTYQDVMPNSPVYADCLAGISAIHCPDDYTVVITTSYVKGDLQYDPIPILPKVLWKDYANDPEDFPGQELIGSGPFVRRMIEENPNDRRWVFDSRVDYFGGFSIIDELQFVYYATANGASRAISTGEVDAALGMTDVQLTTLEGVPGVQLIQAFLPSSQVWAVAFNTRSGVFTEPAMRQAVEYCADRSRMLTMSAGDAGMSGTVWASPGVDYFYNVPSPRGFNPDAAKAIFLSLGYGDVDQDGDLEHVGNKLPLEMRLYTTSDDEWSSTAATILQEGLTSVGVTVRWKNVDGPITEVCGPKDEWDMCMVSWRGDTNAIMAARPFYGSVDSLTGWASDNYMYTYGQLQTATSRDAIVTLAGQLQQIVYDECPYLILGYYSDIQAIRSDRWTGYDQVLETAGGLFGIGCADGYMNVAPAEAAG